MRHFYFRLILGIVFIGCMIYSFVTMNIPFALLYIFLGGVFLYSAYSIWKKEKIIGGKRYEQHDTSFPQQIKRLVYCQSSRTFRFFTGFGDK